MRSRRTRRRFERVVPKPEVVIEDTPQHQVPIGNLEPSRARERRTYEPTEEDNATFRQVVAELLDSLEVEYSVDYSHGDYQRVSIEVGDRQAGTLIGKRGSGIDALETLISRMVSHQRERAVPVQADVNEYRKRHEDDLREEALVRAQRVLETGEDRPPRRTVARGPADHLFRRTRRREGHCDPEGRFGSAIVGLYKQ
jgi:predicted RNA-binding protein Jag